MSWAADTENHLGMNPGDIIQIEGVWMRPKVLDLAWWCILVFGARHPCSTVWWFIRRKVFRLRWNSEKNGPINWGIRRRDLFRKRKLKNMRVTKVTASTVDMENA